MLVAEAVLIGVWYYVECDLEITHVFDACCNLVKFIYVDWPLPTVPIERDLDLESDVIVDEVPVF